MCSWNDASCVPNPLASNSVASMAAGDESGTWRVSDHYLRCRKLAVAFLDEADGRLGADVSSLVKEARAIYENVCDHLWPVADVFNMGKKPIPFGEPDSFHATAADKLRSARDAEMSGLKVLEKIAAAL